MSTGHYAVKRDFGAVVIFYRHAEGYDAGIFAKLHHPWRPIAEVEKDAQFIADCLNGRDGLEAPSEESRV